MKRAVRAPLVVAVVMVCVVAGAALAGHATTPTQTSLTESQRRGREIYTTGTTASGAEIAAFLGDDGVEVPATILPCSGCHGDDGRGNPEGGVTPSDVTWGALTRPYEMTRADGRRRPPYDAAAVRRAIAEGIDAGGQPLNPTMPRYGMAAADLTDLLAYIEVVGEVVDPGIDDTTLTVGVILPPEEELGEMGRAVGSVLRAYFLEVNRRGGMYGRDIELRTMSLPQQADVRAAAVRAFAERERPFVLSTAFIAGADAAIAEVAAELQVPIVGAISLHPDMGFPLNRYVFYLYAGLPQQGQALARYAVSRFHDETARAAIVTMPDALSRQVAGAIATTLESAGLPAGGTYELSPRRSERARLVSSLKESGTAVVFFNGPGEAVIEFLSAAAAIEWNPRLFMAGSSAGNEIFSAPEQASGRVFLAFPTLPRDRDGAAMLEYRSLVEAYGIPPVYRSIQFTAIATARLLLEGLARSGRNLSREKLMRSLEGLYEFETGMMQAISYGPNRRIGAFGAYVVAVDLEADTLGPDAEWVTLR